MTRVASVATGNGDISSRRRLVEAETSMGHSKVPAEGGMGEVHVVVHREERVMKIVKLADADTYAELAKRLMAEGRVLRHTNAVEVLDAGGQTVHMDNKVWGAPRHGKDSQAGMVHEAAHCEPGAADYRYGHDACKALARDDYAKAIWNADNYEFFAESAPP